MPPPDQLSNEAQKRERNIGWRRPINFNALTSPPGWASNTICALLILAALFLIFLAIVAIARLAIDLLGQDTQRASEAVKSLLPLAAAAIGLPLLIWRLVILSHQTRINEEKTQIDRETHYTSIFSRSIDQLGQTRDVKESREGDGGIETITRTAPNIEVRLGGIHSLARLAEESARDRGKIENTLLSYVRENSWSDRSGVASPRRAISTFPSFAWEYEYRRDGDIDKAKKAFTEWRARIGNEAEAVGTWSEGLPETRVDVNEAIDAIATAGGGRQSAYRFYESLFVGRLFKDEIIANSQFERCTFVGCRFEVGNETTFQCVSSQLLNSHLSGTNCHLNFLRCSLHHFAVDALANAHVRLHMCNTYQLFAENLKAVEFNISSGILHRGWVESDDEITFVAKHASFPQVHFRDLTFSEKSQFEQCNFIETHFNSVDLSKVRSISAKALKHARATPATKHPLNIERPNTWPDFDPTYKDDEIPF